MVTPRDRRHYIGGPGVGQAIMRSLRFKLRASLVLRPERHISFTAEQFRSPAGQPTLGTGRSFSVAFGPDF